MKNMMKLAGLCGLTMMMGNVAYADTDLGSMPNKHFTLTVTAADNPEKVVPIGGYLMTFTAKGMTSIKPITDPAKPEPTTPFTTEINANFLGVMLMTGTGANLPEIKLELRDNKGKLLSGTGHSIFASESADGNGTVFAH